MSFAHRTKYLSNDTIAALCTALGGAVAMIRVSGPEAWKAAQTLFLSELADLEPHRVYLQPLYDSNSRRKIDEALVTFFKAPKSFTGEDVVEFSIHASSAIVEIVLESLRKAGARQALAGEFSFRAVRNGKLSLTQAQAIPDLIEAKTPQAAELALEKLEGSQNKLLKDLQKKIRDLCMFGEVAIDFSDQDVPELDLKALQKRAELLILDLQRLRDSFERGQRIQKGVSVALVGIPNAGKSSFFNALLGEDRSIVTEIAGTTRDVLREEVTLKSGELSVTLRLQDTAGLREARDSVEQIGIERTRLAAQQADLIFVIWDPTQPREIQEKAVQSVGLAKENQIWVVTKRDLGGEKNLPRRDAFYEISSKTGEGIEALSRAIVQTCSRWLSRTPGEVLLTRRDQGIAIEKALEHLRRAIVVSEVDLFAADVRHALHSLDVLVGETVPDDILGKIFSEFCIGK